jgi:ferredoxin
MDRSGFDTLLEELQRRGFQTVGPSVRDGAIVYDAITRSSDLPVGYTDRQEAGVYRLEERADGALFGYVVGPHSWKRFLLPPVTTLWTARRHTRGFAVQETQEAASPYAFLGMRACELAAVDVQDRVFLQQTYVDALYAQRRQGAFFVAVNCGMAGRTCFCASMNTGPRVTGGYDLALTEILEAEPHYFVVDVGSVRGAEVMAEVDFEVADTVDLNRCETVTRTAESQIVRRMDTTNIRNLLYSNYEHPRWAQVAQRCLTCANCTMVCPTCFCSTVEDVTDLWGQEASRRRVWDSCFTMDFSYMHGGHARSSTRSRYRQWLTHKLATWIDQFGTSGCVGCGRCITWCPVGIDITEELRAICADDMSPSAPQNGEARRDGNAGIHTG